MATFLLILIVLFALLFSMTLIAVVAYDLWARRQSPPWWTVSRELYALGHTFPAASLCFTAITCLAVGMLLGHLFFGQTVP